MRDTVGGLIRQLQNDYEMGVFRPRSGFSANVNISAVLPARSGFGFAFGECPGEPGCPGDVPWHQPQPPAPLTVEDIERLPPWTDPRNLKPDFPWYEDLWNFIKGIHWSFGPSRAIQVSGMIPSGGKRTPAGVNTYGACSFYEKRTIEGCKPDPLMIGIALVAGVLVIKAIQN